MPLRLRLVLASFLVISMISKSSTLINSSTTEISFVNTSNQRKTGFTSKTADTYSFANETLMDPIRELVTLKAKLLKTSNRIKNLQAQIEKFKRKHAYIVKYFSYMEDHQKERTLYINGMPLVPSNELFSIFQILSREMQILFKYSEIVSMWQTTVKNERNYTYFPIYVKFKTKASKDKYLNRVKYYFTNRYIKKNGCTIKYKGNTFSKLFINEHYSTELTNLFKKASGVASQFGFVCYYNHSHVFIRRNWTDKFPIFDENHLNLLKRNKYAVMYGEYYHQPEVQFDVFDPMIYRKTAEKKLSRT